MSASGRQADPVALHPDGAMVDLTQGRAFQHQIPAGFVSKSLHDGFHAAQVAQTFLAGIGHKPDIGLELLSGLPQRPQESEECSHTKRVVANTRTIDPLVLHSQLRLARGKDRVQVRAHNQGLGGVTAREAGVHVLQSIGRDVLQTFPHEKGPHQLGALALLEGRRRNLLYSRC